MSIKDLTLLLLIVSIGAFVCEIVLIIKYFVNKEKSSISFRSKLFRLAAVLILSIWSLRFFVEISAEHEAWAGLNLIEKMLDSFVHTFQTFSLDEDYTVYTNAGKSFLIDRFGTNIAGILFGFYSSVINVLAPVLGGGLLFEILTSFFPKFRLALACRSKRKKYIFSELNECSVTLAKSIKAEHPSDIIIYTDTYVDPSNERETELYAEAKRENAVCVKDDIINVLQDTKIGLKGTMECFLIDENEYNNLTALAAIVLNEKSREKLYSNKLRIFHSGNIDSLIEEKAIRNMFLQDKSSEEPIQNKSSSENNINESDDNKSIDIQLINCYRLIVWDLYFKCPLYTPLLHQKTPDQLNLVIIGAGSIGIESFLSATWFGQMLNGNEQNVHLNISIINNAPYDEFVKRIIAINPEILLQAQEKNQLLKIYPNNPENSSYGEPYYTLYYAEENIENADFEHLKCHQVSISNEDEYNIIPNKVAYLADADYIIVALGSDDANILTAERLKKQFEYQNIKNCSANENNGIEKVIAYAVYDDNVNNMLMNGEKFELENGILMYAFANLSDIYSYEKISVGRFTESTKFTQAAYENTSLAIKQNLIHLREENLYKKNYDYWSTIARNLDFFYKIYSAFGESAVPLLDDSKYEEEITEKFIKKFEIKSNDDISDPENSYKRKLMWQEHRRWNAYMRQQGYRSAPLNVSKNLKFKWHNCIGECNDEYYDDFSKIINPDKLDDIFIQTNVNYKIYDLPSHFDNERNATVWEEGLVGAYKKYKNKT